MVAYIGGSFDFGVTAIDVSTRRNPRALLALPAMLSSPPCAWGHVRMLDMVAPRYLLLPDV